MFEEELPAAKRVKPLSHMVGDNLEPLSADELRLRITLLKAEIGRLEAAIDAREATKVAASALFKT